jgi:transglutaminase-like putative cysteine protease
LKWIVVALAALLVAAGDAGSAPPVFLGEIEVVARSARPFGRGEEFRVTLEPNDPTKSPFSEMQKRSHAAPDPSGKVTFDSGSYPASREPAGKQHRRASFLIDYDAPDFRAVHDEVERAQGKKPKIADLAEFVGRYITTKNLSRGYDVASVIARRREGDCTEHAVMLAALARSFGVAARVVHGIVLVDEGKRVHAFGHAWVEFRDAAASAATWQPADAALPPSLDRQYVPMDVVEEEGASFGLRMFTRSGFFGLRRVIVEDRPDAGP